MTKKKLARTFLAITMVAGMMATSALAGHNYRFTCTASEANVRTGPGVNYASYGFIYKGESFWVHTTDTDMPDTKNGFTNGHADWGTKLTTAYGYQVNGWVSSNLISGTLN